MSASPGRLHGLDTAQAALFFLVANLLIFFSVGGCRLCGRRCARRRIFDRWEPFSRVDLGGSIEDPVLRGEITARFPAAPPPPQ